MRKCAKTNVGSNIRLKRANLAKFCYKCQIVIKFPFIRTFVVFHTLTPDNVDLFSTNGPKMTLVWSIRGSVSNPQSFFLRPKGNENGCGAQRCKKFCLPKRGPFFQRDVPACLFWLSVYFPWFFPQCD